MVLRLGPCTVRQMFPCGAYRRPSRGTELLPIRMVVRRARSRSRAEVSLWVIGDAITSGRPGGKIPAHQLVSWPSWVRSMTLLRAIRRWVRLGLHLLAWILMLVALTCIEMPAGWLWAPMLCVSRLSTVGYALQPASCVPSGSHGSACPRLLWSGSRSRVEEKARVLPLVIDSTLARAYHWRASSSSTQ